MRLLDVQTYELHTFYGDRIPLYSILSHTWLQDDQEITFEEIFSAPMLQNPPWLRKRGAAKIKFLGEQSARDGYKYAWIDTCCIQKSNSTELSEAINSMFQYYEQSQVCYAYLEDVENEQDFIRSRWWTRAWTLQELLAPSNVIFFDTNHRTIGTKATLAKQIATYVGIDERTLKYPEAMFTASVARRMSWAAHRQASRDEDLAYSLLGIFEINLPMQYGEGVKAFVRLQREILRTTNDHSLFAWGISPLPLDAIFDQQPYSQSSDRSSGMESASETGLFAPHPRYFAGCGNVIAHSVLDHSHVGHAVIEERQGVFSIETESIIVSPDLPKDDILSKLDRFHRLVLLPCSISEAPHSVLGIMLRLWHWHHHDQRDPARAVRDGLRGNIFTFPVSSEFAMRAKMQKYMVDPLAWVSRVRNYAQSDSIARSSSAIRRTLILDCKTEILQPQKSWELNGWRWDTNTATLFCERDGLSANELTLRFTSKYSHGKEGRSALLVALRLGSSMYEVDAFSTQVIAVSNINADVPMKHVYTGPNINAYRGNGQVRFQSIRLHGEISTRWIFNQAVTTFTLWNAAAWKDRQERLQNQALANSAAGGGAAGALQAAGAGFAVGSLLGSF